MNIKNVAFTLVEGATHVETRNSSLKVAFTLAEVMIVLAIIGVVAVLVLPMFVQDMSERTNSHREANIAQKITKSVEVMSVNGDYENFASTEDFVNHLKKYLKIVKVCDKDHLTDCWPARIVKGADGKKYDITTVKTGTQLHTNTTTNTVGLVLADGANIILTYDPLVSAPSSEQNFIPYKKRLPIGKNKFDEFAYSSNATGAIDYVVDLNGSGGPNSEPDETGKFYDIRSFRTAKFSNVEVSCEVKGGFKINGVCIVMVEGYSPVSCTGSSIPSYCEGDSGYINDYLGGAAKACIDLGLKKMSSSQIANLLVADDENLDALRGKTFVAERFMWVTHAYYYNSATGKSGNTSRNNVNYPVLCKE